MVFDAIYREGSLTRAAEHLNLSQPAVSHALARLRERFDDPLFERSGKGMMPTPLAKTIIERVRSALQDLESTLAEGLIFDARHSNRVFTLAVRDVIEFTALPPLMKHLQAIAPDIQLHNMRIPRREMMSQLHGGQIDFAADVLLPVNEDIEHQLLGRENLVVAMRRQHPLAQEILSVDQYSAARHVLVSSRSEGPGVEDFALSRFGRHRHIYLRCQNYHAALQVIKDTDLLLTLPRSYVQQAGAVADVVVRPLPLQLEPVEIHLYWHRKANRDPALMWFKQQAQNCLGTVMDSVGWQQSIEIADGDTDRVTDVD